MITLKQLLEIQPLTGASDIEIIQEYLVKNDLEEEGMDLIHKLTKSKIEKMKRRQHMVKEWTPRLLSKYLYENYDLDTANMLHNLELDYLANGGKLSDSFLKWAKENVPNIIQPEVYFFPLVDWLAERNIKFIERNKE